VDRRSALTLVELLVVVAIVGILLGLLLPAVQAARESARMARCRNNLRQVGVALHNHHSAKGRFPAGNLAKTAGVCPGHSTLPSEDRLNWALAILPFLEQAALREYYDDQASNEADENRLVRETPIDTYLCPSHRIDEELIVPAMGPAASWSMDVPYTPGSYRAVSGRSDGHEYLDNALVDDYPREWRGAMHLAGIIGFGPESISDVIDGASQTLMVGESVSPTGREYGTLWAYSFSFYSLSAATPQQRTLWGDYDRCCQADGDGHSLPCRRGWGSPHPAGIHFLNCDGAVHMVSEDVDMDVFADLSTIAGKELRQTNDVLE